MKKIIFLILFLTIGCHGLFCQGFQTKVFDENIHSLQVKNDGINPIYPIINLNTNDKITVSFDEMSHDGHNYFYKLIHCNADWKQSNLMEIEYIDGFSDGAINNYKYSFGTMFDYTNYSFQIPNEDLQLKCSGNYTIIIYEDILDNVVATACFSVLDEKVNIKGNVRSNTDIDFKGKHQQVDFSIATNNSYKIVSPQTDLKVYVQQNRRTDNMASLVTPSAIFPNEIEYKNNRKLIFEAGNEFKSFDISSLRNFSKEVEHIRYYNPYYHATLYQNTFDQLHQYYSSNDINGRYIVHLQESNAQSEDPDYLFVHFALYSPNPLFGTRIYISGELNNFNYDENNLMEYNAKTMCYEKTMLLKQGGYDYQYTIFPYGSSKGSVELTEGNYWETENEYAIYVYHRMWGENYDRLIGVLVLNSGI